MSVRALLDLSGRVAVVAGGAGHIGRTAVDVLAELGATVVVVDLDAGSCEAVAGEAADRHGVDASGLAVDLTDEHGVRAVPGQVVDRWGRLDVVVHCAGLVGTRTDVAGWAVPFEQQSVSAWNAALDVNLTSAFVLTQAAAPHLAASGNGAVVHVSSIHGLVAPDPGLYVGTDMASPAAYAASKGALLQLTRWLASYLAPAVRVNAISPGGIERGQDPVFVERYEARTALGRMGRESDLAGAVAYLASDLSAYVTGQNLVVDGGWSIR